MIEAKGGSFVTAPNKTRCGPALSRADSEKFGFHGRNFGPARKSLAKKLGKQKEGSRLPSFAFTRFSLR